MTYRDLRQEIETRLLRCPRSLDALRRALQYDSAVERKMVIECVADLQAMGRLIEIEGKLYVQRPPEAA